MIETSHANRRRLCERSEAIQTLGKAAPLDRKASGLLRRFAPRKDGEVAGMSRTEASTPIGADSPRRLSRRARRRMKAPPNGGV
ncbi:MAG: hypothetical protein KGQ28_05720, partial [Hyphomicrobiales bacterium]|nr:hypothetical protein [Hyphomicrobiales bacterium]